MSWAFLMITTLIHIGFILSLWTGMLNPFFHDTEYLLGQGADFFAFYQAGNNVLNGLSCYEIPDSLVVPYLYPYRYLPYFAYSFGVMMNLAPPLIAYWLWIGIVVVSLWLAVLRTRSLSKLLNRPNWDGRIAIGMWLVFSPIYIELYLGQVTLIAGILLFFALTTPSFVQGQKTKWSMTFFWITSGLTKLIPYLAAPVLFAAGRVRSVLVAFVVTILAVVAVPAGLESLRFFLDFNIARANQISGYAGSHSLKMLLYYLLGEPGNDFTIITGLLTGIFIMITIGVILYSRDVWTCAGLFIMSYFFIMTDVWEHHYTIILPLLVLAWIRGRPEDKARWVPFTLVLLMSLPVMPIIEFLSGVGPGVHPIYWGPIWQIIYHSSKIIPALIFYGWLMLTAFRSPRASFLDSFRNAWVGLIGRNTPSMEAGILVRIEHVDSSHV
ncbi:MAG: glycosyltransferase family 87 protein [Candidatus Sifarchaeia archaeon]